MITNKRVIHSLKRFNGATTFQPWIVQFTVAMEMVMTIEGFNGATTFQPWIGKTLVLLKYAEGFVSMGPRLFSHG